MGNGLAKLQQGDESCVGGKPARVYGIQYSPSRDSLGRWLWVLEHTPSCGTRGVFIIHGVCSVEFFLPKHEQVDSYQAVRVAWPPPALPRAVAQKKQQEKKKDLTAAVLPTALASQNQPMGQTTCPQAVGFLSSSHQSYLISLIAIRVVT